jgi:hypothetical protein
MAALADRRKNVSAATRSDRRSGGPGRQTRLFGHEPGPVGASVDPLALLPGRVLPTGLVVGDETVSGDVTVGIVGTNGVIPTVGNTLIVGTAAAALTPRLPISIDPNGIPVRAPPPGVVGDVDVGVDDEATLLEPEPHIPDNPVVSSIAEVVDIPVPDIAVAPDVAAVAGVAAPTSVPPPSKLAVDPYIPDGEVPNVEHVVPLPGIAIVPVELAGSGLTPGDAISVEPSGIPVGETDEPDVIPSGEVAPIVGVGAAIPLICAMATLLTNSAGSTAAINEYLIGMLRLQTASPRRALTSISFASISLGAKLSDIGQSLVIALRCRW